MLSKRTLSALNATGRKQENVPARIRHARDAICALIDDYWLYYRAPDKYQFARTQRNPATGQAEEVFTVGEWKQRHHVIRHDKGDVVISIPWKGELLPLTEDGDHEIVMAAPTMADLEEVLATIKEAVRNGKADRHL